MPQAAALILDLGGVLLDVDFERTLSVWARHGARVPSTPPAPDEAYERFERGETTFADYAEHLRSHHGVRLDDAALLEGWNAALGEPLPGAPELVEAAARRWPLYLFTNTNAAHHACWSQRIAWLLAPFTALFISHELGLRKPDPCGFEHVVARIGVEAARALFLDDAQDNVDGARAAGLAARRVSGPAHAARVLGLDIAAQNR